MATEPLLTGNSTLYDEDFFAWTQETACLLRAGRLQEIDIAHLAEEIEDMGKSERRERDSRLTQLILHLLKWRYQPERRSASWKATITVQRIEILDLLDDSPSLRRSLQEAVAKAYGNAVSIGSTETSLPPDRFPAECPFTPDQILNRDFLPE